MKLTSQDITEILIGLVVFVAISYAVISVTPPKFRTLAKYAAFISGAALMFYGIGHYIDIHDRAIDVAKAAIAIVAASAVFYESQRAGARRPVAERWKKFVGITLALAAIVCYFSAFRFGYPKYYHRHDQFHYYLGAKYFPEMGYDGLYKCTLIAQDELGVVRYISEDTGREVLLDMKKEVRRPDKKIRNLGDDNLLKPASDFLDKPQLCKPHFSPERWESFKQDVQFFRTVSDKGYWEQMQHDHGFNPPPVWTIMGYSLSNLHPATTGYLQFLASFDVVYNLGVFVALYWAFGWRISALAAIFWGCQASASSFWTLGAFLRQDWLFFLVFSVCCLRKRYFMLAGASLVYSALLRIFPGLVVIGWLTVAGYFIIRHQRMAKSHLRVLLGAVLAAAVLIPLSIKISGKDSYQQFYEHTLKVHDQTPLTNHMGLRVLIAHQIGTEGDSGRMKYIRDSKLVDPFETWKRLRNERYDKYRWFAYAIIAVSLAFFVYVCKRIKSLWVAQCLAQLFIILLSQLTCYYYAFMILSAPLSRLKRQMEVPLLGFAALSQFVWLGLPWNDDKYTALTLLSLVFCFYLLCLFAKNIFFRQPAAKAQEAVPSGSG